MRKGYWAIFLAVIVCAAASLKVYHHVQACRPQFDERYVYLSGGPNRVILIPGMDGSAKNFLSTPIFHDLADGYRKVGADVVILNTPIPRPCWFSDGGAVYRAAFLHELDDVVSDADRRHGARRTLIAGISYGGLHAMIGYALRPFAGWQAGGSVTKMAALEELRSVGDVPAFDPFPLAAQIKRGPGYITWGGKDGRVDQRLTEQLFAQIRSPAVVGKGYPWLGHETDPKTVRDLLADAHRQLQ